ncbi:MAG: VWA domain-containing protein [bacterium]|nr:VWA domain-containing protein [bacterium]
MKTIVKILLKAAAPFIIVLLTLSSCEFVEYPYYIEERQGYIDEFAFSVIIDGSGSMLSVMPEIQTALHSLLDSMTNDDYMQFIRSGETPVLLNSHTNNKTELTTSIEGLTASGDHERYDLAIDLALENSMENKLNVILLFGDGYIYYGDEPSSDQVLADISNSSINGNGVVFTFGISGYDTTNLTEIAQAGRGSFYPVDDPSQFGSLYNEIKKISQKELN